MKYPPLTAFIKKDYLLDPSMLSVENRYAAMIDGRTIHFFFQFIEPLLLEIYPSLKINVDNELPGQSVNSTFSSLKFAKINIERTFGSEPNLLQIGTLPCHPHLSVKVFLDLNDSTSSHSSKSATLSNLIKARAEIDRTRLGFFIDIALGAVILSSNKPKRFLDCVSVFQERNNTNFLTESLLKQAAQALFALWIRAEIFARDGSPPLTFTEFEELGLSLFGCCVVAEYRRRAMKATPSQILLDKWSEKEAFLLNSPKDMLVWIEHLSNLPLCRELLACWYPLWNRSTFIFDSPLDTVSDLRVFHRSGSTP